MVGGRCAVDSLRGAMSMYDSRSSGVGNVGAGDLTGAAAAAISGPQTTGVAAMDSRYRLNVADQSRSRTDQAEVSANGTDRRDAASDDVIATKEVEVCTAVWCSVRRRHVSGIDSSKSVIE